MSDFDEEKHPRDERGKFIDTGGDKLRAWGLSWESRAPKDLHLPPGSSRADVREWVSSVRDYVRTHPSATIDVHKDEQGHGHVSVNPNGGAVGIREAQPKEWRERFEAAFAGSPFKNHVSHYSEEDLSHMKLFLAEDGKAGIAIHDHGDGRIEGTALFNQGSTPGMGSRLLKHAIEKGGVNYVECYGHVLKGIYEKLGFKVESESPFNPEYAAPDWDYKKFPAAETPYFTLRLQKGSDEKDKAK